MKRLAERGLEAAERNQLLSIAEGMDPSLELKRVLESEEVNEWVLPVDMSDQQTADEALENGEVSGIITVPVRLFCPSLGTCVTE
ncbi:MAG: hypothetical protein U5K84_12490 [Alkalibacterium sp.]|nr:hypothetical protein [Alkalibacterium sp.]